LSKSEKTTSLANDIVKECDKRISPQESRPSDTIQPKTLSFGSIQQQSVNFKSDSEIFRDFFPEINDLLTVQYNRMQVSGHLFRAKLISWTCHQNVNDNSNRTDRERANELMTALTNKINREPGSLQILIDIFKQIEEFADIAEKISRSFKT
jgi:hypothetical protein